MVALALAAGSTLAVIPVSATPAFAAETPGTVVAWGNNEYSQTNVPAGLTNVVAIDAGALNSLALTSGGTVAAWAFNDYGQNSVPAGLASVIAIASGGTHSLALKADGTVVGWGNNEYRQATPPAGLANVTAISAGGYFSLALKSNGTVVGWGNNWYGQTSVPSGLSGVVAISAGDFHSLALKADGTVVGWGDNESGEATPPAGLGNVTAISAGGYSSLALKSDGTVVGWGDNWSGEATPPAGLGNVTAISAGGNHSLALKSNGTVVGWGSDWSGEATPPAGLGNVTAISAGYDHSLALAGAVPTAPTSFSVTKDVSARTATISWQLPASNGGSAITGYLVSRDAGTIAGQNPWSTVVAASARTHQFRYLTPGSTYTLSVRAINALGQGPAASGTVTMSVAVPSAPTSVSVTKSDVNRTATIYWQPPASSGGSAITGYLVARDAGTVAGQNPWSTVVAASARSHQFRYLTPGSTYTLTVQAINGTGVGPVASGKVTVGTVAANLVKNPGFEVDANADGRPDSWTSNPKFTRSATLVYSGNYAGRHRATTNTGHTITQVVSSLLPQTAYRMSARVNIPATADTFTFLVRVRWLNSAGTVLRTDVVQRYTAGTGGWRQAFRATTSPTGTVKAQVQMVATNLNATIYVDDLTLSRG